MALPVTITGISLDVATVGPYQSSGGNFYFIGVDASVATTIRCMKATDPADSWDSIDTQTGYSISILDIAAVRTGDVIHLAIADQPVYGKKNFKYLTFDMSSESFVTAETIATSIDWSGQVIPLCSIAVRSTGVPVVFFQGPPNPVYLPSIYYSRRIGTNNWAAPIEVDDAESGFGYYNPVAILGDNDSVHCLYLSIEGAQRTYQRTLASDNSLKASTFISGGNRLSEGISFDLLH